MNLLYNIGINFFKLGIFIASFFNDKARKLHVGQSEAYAILKEKIDPNAHYIWFHAASLGEFEQGRPVMEQLKRANQETKILLTFFSPSGYEIRKNYAGADIISYLPIDTPDAAKQFVKLVNPSKVIFIKYEFWPNYILALKTANVPVYSISSIFRPSQLFFKWYGAWYRNLLKMFSHIFLQDEYSVKLLEKHGFKNASVAGDTRFDRVTDLAKQAKSIPLVEAFVHGAKKVIVAGSTWPKDEELLIRYLKAHTDVKLILVPHEIHEAHILGITKLVDMNCVRYTQADILTAQIADCMIVDTIGLLSSIYRYAHIAYIGGGFGAGIHNTLEAAVWNIPVVFGPNYGKFREARELIAEGGGFSIGNCEDLEKELDKLLKNIEAGKIAGDYVKKNTGATKLILEKLIHS
ncbi:MAG: glycosyltransferase N-terminal domain-containing protein [Paludibacter sp.]|nr:glycosyltransferase N-terminal domain-containing protein [Paludibacter sp.]